MDPQDPLSPALAVLTAMITPAVLVTACGSLLQLTSTRLARIGDRVQAWSNQLAAAGGMPPKDQDQWAREQRALITAQLSETARRAHLLRWAMTAFSIAVAAFVADMVAIGIVALVHPGAVWITVALGLLGAGSLFVGSILLIVEARHALATTHRELAFVQHHAIEPAEPPP